MCRLFLIALLVALCGAIAHADEGMWQPAQLSTLAKTLKTRGLKLKAQSLANPVGYPLGAVIRLDHCSASFVSPDGLILTSHQCAQDVLQYHSTPEQNLMVDGFLAPTRGDELRGSPGMRVYVTETISDVTQQVKAHLHPWFSGSERYGAVEKVEKQLVDGCESPGYHCAVHALYDGLKYQLVKQLEIKDVRLVYAPPASIGRFGGAVDAGTWPRHSGDFSFLRAYVGRYGRPVAYSADNVPYHPQHVLKLNPAGLQPGNFVMVAGYPRRSHRHRLVDQVADAINWRYPAEMKIDQDLLGIINQAAAKHPQVAVTYANTVAALSRSLKIARGEITGLRRAGVIDVKRAHDAQLEDWLKKQGGRKNMALIADINQLRAAIAANKSSRERDRTLRLLKRPALLRTALRMVHLAKARAKPDRDRDPGFQQRDWMRIKDRLTQLSHRFDPSVDQQLLVYALSRYLALPKDQHLSALDDWLDDADDKAELTAKVAKLYAGSKLAQANARAQWFAADTKAVDASDDSLIELARALQPQLATLRAERSARVGDLMKLRARHMQALIAWQRAQGRPVYPDANGSLRISFGTVQGVAPRDAVQYAPFTMVSGIVEKNTGVAPFDAPQPELDAIAAKAFDGYASKKLGTLPVDFIAGLDVASGNSGSPTLDAHGRLVGLVFDRNWRSVSGNWLFRPKLNRSIQVDLRYVLWVMHHLAHADRLVREMGLKAPAP